MLCFSNDNDRLLLSWCPLRCIPSRFLNSLYATAAGAVVVMAEAAAVRRVISASPAAVADVGTGEALKIRCRVLFFYTLFQGHKSFFLSLS